MTDRDCWFEVMINNDSWMIQCYEANAQIPRIPHTWSLKYV